MIHRFRVSNFQSIREDVTLDFRVPGTTPDLHCFRRSRSRPDVRLPTVVALVGPNGSGKTALLRAMIETIRFASSSYDRSSGGNIPTFIPFLAPDTKAAPTRVEVDFDARWLSSDTEEPDALLRYTLELERDSSNIIPTRVAYEALHAFPKGRPRRILERRVDSAVYISREMGVRPRDDRLASIPPNASAISALAKMRVGSFPTIAADIDNSQTNIVGPDPLRLDTETVTNYYRDNQFLVEKVSDKLRRFDLGIESMRIAYLPDGKPLLTFAHCGLDSPVVLLQESAGTRHLVHTFPQLNFVLETGHLAIMDAFDSDFHTELLADIFGWFRHEETNRNKAQLICSIHNLSVLDDLEKEEMFVIEKSQDGATRAQAARNILGLRRNGNLQKQYRSGAMGGLPIFG